MGDTMDGILTLVHPELEGRRFQPHVFRYVQNNTIMHGHSFAEIAVMISGNGYHRTLRGGHMLARGDVLLVPYGAVHAYEEVDDLRLVNILFKPEQLPLFLELHQLPGCETLLRGEKDWAGGIPEIRRCHFDGADMEFVSGLLDLMIKENEDDLVGGRCCVAGYLMALLGRIARAGVIAPEAGAAIPEAVANALAFLRDHYQEPICLKDLVKVARMSPSSFMRVFLRTVGDSPMRHLAKIRVANACLLLHNTRLAVTEIAGRVGFDDSNYFSRLFRAHIGVPPREFRDGGGLPRDAEKH